MELLNAVVSSVVLLVVATVMAFYLRGRFTDVHRRIDELRDDVRGLRADFTQLAFALAGRHPDAG